MANILKSSLLSPARVLRGFCKFHSRGSRNHAQPWVRALATGPFDPRPPRPARLMGLSPRTGMNPYKALKSSLLLKHLQSNLDHRFDKNEFLDGVAHAVGVVSGYLSRGHFDRLGDMVSQDAIKYIYENYKKLNEQQRFWLEVLPEDIYRKFIYDVDIITNTQTNFKTVDIFTVLLGFHGWAEVIADDRISPAVFAKNTSNHFACNYIMRRVYWLDGSEPGEWTICALNHFNPTQVTMFPSRS